MTGVLCTVGGARVYFKDYKYVGIKRIEIFYSLNYLKKLWIILHKLILYNDAYNSFYLTLQDMKTWPKVTKYRRRSQKLYSINCGQDGHVYKTYICTFIHSFYTLP